ncbi:PH domain-containing protein [Streptomyces sp. NPDC060064]|uniref:PH domain-containing protein n=1 Tax=Streptomyces sp. NPDC060064 TaxID=3347049 RepID=UPI0036A8E4C7
MTTPTRVAAAWHRPAPRTLLVHCGWLAPPLGSLALTALATGGRIPASGWITLAAVAVSFTVITVVGLIRWSRTHYQVTADSFALRSGVLNRRLRTLPLHRIRSVDLTATPLHRLLGLTVVRAGATTSGDGRGEIALDALTVRDAHRLRTALLARADVHALADDPLLARIDRRWLRYAPFTFWVIGGVGIAFGTVYRVFDGIGIELWRVGFVRDAFTEFGNSALWLTVPAALFAVIALGSIGALALYVENWWGFSAVWTDARTLTVRRGLLTTRAVTVERARLHGVLLREPLLLRAAGGATAMVVAGGLGDREEARRRSALLPPAPRDEALRVTAGALRAARHPFESVPLTAHPRVALRRRMMRGLLFFVLPVTATLLVLGALLTTVLLHCAWIFALVATPVVWLLARDAYRSLGHALNGPHLLVRAGTFSRDTLALERDAIAAWTFSSSPFARRAGLVTLTAAVAAGEHGYRVRDFAAVEAPAFAATAAPGILDEFLQKR